jgi:predicted nucleotidyltransferase component of viral defense system
MFLTLRAIGVLLNYILPDFVISMLLFLLLSIVFRQNFIKVSTELLRNKRGKAPILNQLLK